MRPKSKTPLIAALITLFICSLSYAFEGEVKADNINVRSDSTVASQSICALKRGDRVEVVSQAYEWCKIRLPSHAPSFIKRSFVSMIDDKAAKVNADNVNIRLGPSDSSVILGKVKENEVINVLEEAGDWYRIEPVNNSFGWVHSRFIKPFERADKPAVKEEALAKDSGFSAEGIIRPKTIRRIATHKLIADNGEVFLLKGNKTNLDALNNRKARVSGKVNYLPNQEYPLIEIAKMEALD